MLSYPVNSRELTSFLPIESELTFETSKNYLFDLSYLGALQVLGERSCEFLQGQLTCDLREITLNTMRESAICNLKGRILALMDVVNVLDQGLHLILPKDLLTQTEHSLAKTAALSKVTLQKVSNYRVFGFYLQNKSDKIPFSFELPKSPFSVVQEKGYCCYRLNASFFVLFTHEQHAEPLCSFFIDKGQWRGSLAWHALQLQHGKISIYPESRGLFLPHRLGLHLTGHLSFDKGCYKGQEIIARMHYRSSIKHTLQQFTLQRTSQVSLESGQIITDATGREVGEVIDYCPLEGNKILVLASVISDHLGSLHVGENLLS